jgi:thymidylate kinase
MNKGIFITIEGTDGSGKTTQIKKIEEYFREKGYEVVLTRDPGGTLISESIRKIVLDPGNSEMSKTTELLLYYAARAQLADQLIKPALNEGRIVICDRYIDSTYVYQGYGRGFSRETIDQLNEISLSGVIPDQTFFLDLSPEVALKRRLNASALDRIEKERIDFHMRVYNGYKKLCDIFPERIARIDASNSKNKVFEDIKEILNQIVKKSE